MCSIPGRAVLIVFGGLLLWAAGAVAQVAAPDSAQPGQRAGVSAKKSSVQHLNYHGWPDSILLQNGVAEIAIVPAIGRVMQFGFTGEQGVFWENRDLDGRSLDPSAKDWSTTEWINFGGDKSWPSPEAEWSKYTGRKGWRPPPAFDAMPVQARVEGADVILTSPVDPFLGVRIRRRVHLAPGKAVMTITTTYERVTGEPARIGVWVITQLKNPVGIYVAVPGNTKFTNGYLLLGKDAPPDLKFQEGSARTGGGKLRADLLYLSRNPKAAHKIGTEASTLLWVGETCALRIDSPRVARENYPDQGSSAEIYTNPDPLKYIELEMLGPLRAMKVGDKIERVTSYTLSRRTELTPDAEARKILRK